MALTGIDSTLGKIRCACDHCHLMTRTSPFLTMLERARGGGIDLGWKIVREKKYVHALPAQLHLRNRSGHFKFNEYIRNCHPELRVPSAGYRRRLPSCRTPSYLSSPPHHLTTGCIIGYYSHLWMELIPSDGFLF